MSIETYTSIIICLYMGLCLLSILMGAVEIGRRLWKKPPKFWLGIIPCTILYSLSAVFSTIGIGASIAYDDITDSNYGKYENWGLYDFILHDIKTFIIWLVIGILLYWVFGRESTKKSIKTGCAMVLVFVMILFMVFLLMIKV